MIAILLLGVVVAILIRSQVVFKNKLYNQLTMALSNLILILLPLFALISDLELGEDWRNVFYLVSYAFFSVYVLITTKDWQKLWALILLWPILPYIYTYNNLGLWIALITAEFLLLMAFLEQPFKSDYHKLALIRILVIFQYFVFDYMFIHNRVAVTAQALAIVLILLYTISIYDLLAKFRIKQPRLLIFLITFIQYGVMMFDKVILDAFGFSS
jgi:hypothetical protein